MDAGEGRPVLVWVDHLFGGEERRQGRSARRLKGSLHAAGSGVGGHQPVRWVVRLHGVGQELVVEELQFVRQREGVGLVVEMADGGHLTGASADAEGCILHGLKLCDSEGGGVGGPDWGGVGEDGLN